MPSFQIHLTQALSASLRAIKQAYPDCQPELPIVADKAEAEETIEAEISRQLGFMTPKGIADRLEFNGSPFWLLCFVIENEDEWSIEVTQYPLLP